MAKFDVDGDLVRKLSALLEETGLSELEFASGDQSIRVARTPPQPAGQIATPAPSQATAAVAPEPAAEETAAGTVTAPMVGTVYLSPEPGAPPFVQPGDVVAEGQTLLLIEAMKTFNPVRSPSSGKIQRILVADSSPVEYGEALMILE
jgi:acetyl-CoA carboxylase biotin carboxyl carrier protein